MHELSIAMSIVDLATEEAAQRRVTVTGVRVKVGELSGVVKDALVACYEMASLDTPLQGSRLMVEEVPVRVLCPSCKSERPIRSIQLFCCAECGAPVSEIVQGKELQLAALEVE